LGIADDIVQAGIYHYFYATALYFLKAQERSLFYNYVEKSSDGKWFFDERHKTIYNNNNNFEKLRKKYFSPKVID